MASLYGGYTLKQLREMIETSNLTETSIDMLCGGDEGASCVIIQDLIKRIEDLTMFANELERSRDEAWRGK